LEQKIKLKIGNRVYPLTTQLEQEEGLRNASKKIDIMIKHFEEKYAVKDKQDALAMCALQLATQSEQENVSEAKISEEVNKRLDNLNESVQEIIDL
jgi:cell division protein ZapA